MSWRILVYIGLLLCVIFIACGVLWLYWGGELLFSRSTVFVPSVIVDEKEFPIDETNRYISVCNDETQFATTSDQRFCGNPPLLNRLRLFQIDLTHNVILFFEHGVLKNTFPVAYQAPYGKWYQTPTGYFEAGVKRPKFMSSIFPVWMEHAVQLYEDFFIHAIPYYSDGTPVSSQFSGGCLRLDDEIASNFYKTIQRGDETIVYLSLADAKMNNDFFSPVSVKDFWIRQRFNSPLRTDWNWYEDKQYNYIQHAGVDFSPNPNANDLSVYSIATGTVARIVRNGDGDAGLGNTVIIAHNLNNTTRYALYGHLSHISDTLQTGSVVEAGEVIGLVGNTGYGCDYWRIGTDGCDQSSTEPDIHLHLEIKTDPVLTAPISDVCTLPSGKQTHCVGYTSHNPTQFGYEDPIPVLYSSGVLGTSSSLY